MLRFVLDYLWKVDYVLLFCLFVWFLLLFEFVIFEEDDNIRYLRE